MSYFLAFDPAERVGDGVLDDGLYTDLGDNTLQYKLRVDNLTCFTYVCIYYYSLLSAKIATVPPVKQLLL